MTKENTNANTDKQQMTPEQRAEWVASTEQKFDDFVKGLAEAGAFQKLEECKDNIKAPMLIMGGGYPYSLNEKGIPLIAHLGTLGYLDGANKGFSTHVFVTKPAIDRGNTKSIYPKKGTHYIDLTVRRKMGGRVLDSPQKIYPMWQLSGKFTDKAKQFLVDKDGHHQAIPYDTYGTRIAHLVDYASITKEAVEKDGAKAVISAAWDAAKERHREIIAQTQPEYDKRVEAIKQTDITKSPKNHNKDFLLFLKRSYDAVMAKENAPDVTFPNSVTFQAAKAALLAGASTETVMKAIDAFAPGAARDFGSIHHSENVMNALKTDFTFQRQLKEVQEKQQEKATQR